MDMEKRFLSHAYEVSCRIRAGDVALPRYTDSPRAGPAPGRCLDSPGSRPVRRKEVVPPLLPLGSGLRRGRWAGFGVPATWSALANGIDRKQAAPRNSTLSPCGGSHMNERSLIRDFLLIRNGFRCTQCAGLNALRYVCGTS